MQFHRILLIEDDADCRESLSQLLETMGQEVASAQTGAEGLRLADQKAFDVALVDLTLPDLSGLEVGRKLSRLSPRPYLVAYTGWGRDSDIERTREAGFDTHLTKPVGIEKLSALLKSLP